MVQHSPKVLASKEKATALLWSNHRVFYQSCQYHPMVVKTSCIPSVKTDHTVVVKSPCISPVRTVPHHGGQIVVHSIGQDSTTLWWSNHRNFISHGSTTLWWSNRRTFHQSRQYHTVVVRSEACENVTMGGETQTSAPNAL